MEQYKIVEQHLLDTISVLNSVRDYTALEVDEGIRDRANKLVKKCLMYMDKDLKLLDGLKNENS